MFRRFVNAAEVLALLAAAVFVVMLFANQPDDGGRGGGAAAGPGAELYAANCARCHGAEGGGGIGPRLSDGAVVEAFPDAADEVVVVTDGRGSMPSFAERLSAAEIRDVVEYTRTF
ncbi:MAG TPA: cytochrome c [Acidimicrobiia bacterium]